MLFPETVRADEEDEEDGMDDVMFDDGVGDGVEEHEVEEEDIDDGNDDQEEEEEGDLDTRVSAMVDALQEWRAKNEKVEYQDWDTDAKREFGKWLTKYIDLVTPNSDDDDEPNSSNRVDLDATREQSESFWSRVQDETEAEILLDHLTSTTTTPTTTTTTNPKTNEAYTTFLHLPRPLQLHHLTNLGTLR